MVLAGAKGAQAFKGAVVQEAEERQQVKELVSCSSSYLHSVMKLDIDFFPVWLAMDLSDAQTCWFHHTQFLLQRLVHASATALLLQLFVRQLC